MIGDISLQYFRSYKEESFEFSPSVNIIVGPNASGKTNLLESVLVTARGSSYRAKDAELVAYDASWLRLEAHGPQDETRLVYIEKHGDRSQKQFKINDQPLSRLSLQKTLPAVVFEPNHLLLLTGSPDLRRQFIDDLLEQTVTGFGSIRRQYRRALSQRNTLLKNRHRITPDQLFVWNVRLSEYAELIVRARHGLIEAMNSSFTELYEALAQVSSTVKLSYKGLAATEHYGTALLKRLEAHLEQDIERGFTTYGPHRDDIQILLNGHPVQDTASRGETRTLLLVLKMIEAIQLEEARGQRPMLLLDDVFSELDGRRRQALTQFLQPYQTFITTTDADVVIQHFTETAHIIPLS